VAMRLCMERLVPVSRASGKRFHMPPVKTAADLAVAAEAVTQAIAKGRITAQDGDAITNILEKRRRIIDTEDLERRLREVEKRSGVKRRVSPREETRWLTARKTCYDFAESCYANIENKGKTTKLEIRLRWFAVPEWAHQRAGPNPARACSPPAD